MAKGKKEVEMKPYEVLIVNDEEISLDVKVMAPSMEQAKLSVVAENNANVNKRTIVYVRPFCFED